MLSKKTPILIVGFGSIGKRHYRNLLGLGYRKIGVYDSIDEAFDGMKGVERVFELDVDTARPFRIAFICTPNHLHVTHAKLCAEAGCHLFVEKPLSHTMQGVKELERLCKRRKLLTMVGCNMRYHPCLRFIKKALEAKKLGFIYSIRHEFGFYLPSWRPTQDIRENYAAHRRLGGGIMLDDIHEFDLLHWLNDFSPITKACFIYDKVSRLEIDTEDMCIATFQFANSVMGLVACDYLQQRYRRSCVVIGEKGNLRWSMNDNIVWLDTSASQKKLFQKTDFDINTMYVDEVRDFFRCLDANKETQNPISLATAILRTLPTTSYANTG